MNEQDLRDCFAMFAMFKMAWERGQDEINARDCYTIADAMLEARKPQPEVGITAVKPKQRRSK
jgi:hypothetical protein